MTPLPPSQRSSALWRMIRAGASLRLAVFELLALALACAVATVCESRFDAEVAQSWFYNAPWFLLWLGLLCANLVCATLVRWPWRRKDAGFVLTHYAIVLLLAGAMIGHKYGFEAGVRLHTSIPLNETQMVFAHYEPVVMSRGGAPSGYHISLSAEDGPEPKITVEWRHGRHEVFGLSSVLGKTVRLPGDTAQLCIRNYWPDFAMEQGGPTSKSDQPNNPAILVQLTGPEAVQEPVSDRPLAFGVQLVRFDVPRDEATGTPSDFRSTIRFTDPATGEKLDAVLSMNHPASFPAGFWRTALGLNCRFSQAEWNPDDLGETTLQVTHDPGWPLKWIGSLLLCLGMAGMFYLK